MKYLSLVSVCVVAFALTGCDSVDDVAKNIELGKQVVQNQAILEAGKEVLTGTKELANGGKDLIVQGTETITDGGGKILSNGRIIFDESQEILNALEVENELQPEVGATILLQEDTEGCGGDVACYLWREDLDSPWKSLKGKIANLDEFAGQVQDLQVIFAGIDEALGVWNVEAVSPNEE